MKIILATAVIVVLLAGSIGGSYALSLHAIDTSQHRWCKTLALLTSGPAPSLKENGGRSLVFYLHLKELERDFGC